MPSPFSLFIRVRYAECDPQQVVFNARYAEYADLAATEYMRAVIGGYHQLIEKGYDNQVVNLNISWSSSAKFDDVLKITVEVGNMGNTSFSLKIEISDVGTQRHIASAELVYVMVDSQTFEKIVIPEEIKLQLIDGARNKSVNLSGTECPD
ncbi:thioesterase family protein [Aliiglaciecola sp. LCG003]|uniref:acyl-CoA thioesterase n=1 Tax=Aliiglaciecola sp. LCG003 TaxID=3053655 RepID=UPI002574342E|nr:thioesterase family protein [Aliiglaciecola sp. LCG003]WJG07759.1 thioesterase family protein [Aliiglaciecola sp. LCG003]